MKRQPDSVVISSSASDVKKGAKLVNRTGEVLDGIAQRLLK